MDHRNRKYLGTGKKVNDTPTTSQVKFYNNGTIISNVFLTDGRTFHITGNYAAGASSDWQTMSSIYDGETVSGTIGYVRPRMFGKNTIDVSFPVQAGKQYLVQQNCWAPADPCYSVTVTDM